MSDLLDDSQHSFGNQQSSNNNKQIPRADFGVRLGAHLLDALFSLIIMVIVIFSAVGFDTTVLVDFLENMVHHRFLEFNKRAAAPRGLNHR